MWRSDGGLAVRGLAWLSDGRLLVQRHVLGGEGPVTVDVLDGASGERLLTLQRPDGAALPTAMGCLPDGRLIVAWLESWEGRDGLRLVEGEDHVVLERRLDANYTSIHAGVAADGTVVVAGEHAVDVLRPGPPGTTLAKAKAPQRAGVVRRRKRAPEPSAGWTVERSIGLGTEPATYVSISPDGTTVLAASVGSEVLKAFDRASGRQRWRGYLEGWLESWAWSSDGASFALVRRPANAPEVGHGERRRYEVLLASASTGRAIGRRDRFQVDGGSAVAFLPEGYAVGRVDGTLTWLDGEGVVRDDTPVAPGDRISALSCSPDGSRIAAGTASGALMVLEVPR